MTRNFKIRPSSKTGLNFELGGIVTRGRTVFLRILGDPALCAIVTATANEDGSFFVACSDQARLIASASQTRLNLGLDAPVIVEDDSGRPFVEICTFTEADDAYQVADVFFAVFDQ